MREFSFKGFYFTYKNLNRYIYIYISDVPLTVKSVRVWLEKIKKLKSEIEDVDGNIYFRF